MSKTLRPSLLCTLISLTTVITASAGTFTANFNSGVPAGATCYGNAFVDTTGGIANSGCLKMTTNAPSQTAGFVIDDLDSGAAINAFTATFQLYLGGGTIPPADGFSFNFASNIPDGTMDETGAPSTGLTIEFHTFTNTASGIGIHILWNGAILATNLMPVASLVTGTYTNVVIQLTTNGLVNVSYGNAIIYTNRALPGFQPMAGQFGLGARCGSDDENCWLDNLSINTTPILHPVVLADSPTGTNVVPNPVITVQLWDGSLSQVDQSTIQMMLDGSNVLSPTITESNALTVVQYDVPAVASGSSNWVMVTFKDNGSPAVSYTNVFGFIAMTYPTIPPSYMATADTTQPGFTERIFQGGTATVASAETADAMLAGLYYNTANGTLWPNTAGTNTDGTWTFVQTGTINYNLAAPAPLGEFPYFYTAQYPGMPGITGSTNDFAYEAITYLYLAPGIYTFGVNSDDGFRLTCLDKQLGTFDAGRAAADTIFYFAVSQTGYYPFRLVYFQGTGTASLEWFSEDSSGNKTLINDTGDGGIPAYAVATTALPYFLVGSPTGTGNRANQPIVVQMQDGVGIKVNTNAIHLTVNGAAVAPSITWTAGVTTVQYSRIWASGSTNTAVVWFADNEVSPVSQTNQFTFSAATYTTIPASYAISASAVDTTKPGYEQSVFQTSQTISYTIENAETMLAGQFFDPYGNPYPNVAAKNTDGSYNYVQANTINYNIAAPAQAGDFPGDVLFPGIPGTSGSTTNFALQAITYLYLTPGYYTLGVNSDDGFRLTTSPNPYEEFPYQIAVFDGTRAAADTTGGFGITNAGYYPFRLVYFQATGPASLELFSSSYTGARTLVNDTTSPAPLLAYRSANNTQPYCQWAYPYRAGSYCAGSGLPVSFTLVDGTPAVQLSSIQLTFNGAVVSPTVTRGNGTNIFVDYFPPVPATTNTTATVQLVWADASGHYNTNAFSFTYYGSDALAPTWSLAPGSRSYLTNDAATGSALEAGMAYNPVTGHLVVGSLINTNTLRGFYILDALTGNDMGQLAQTNSSGVNQFSPPATGVNYPGYTISIASDGAIYAASRQAAGQDYAIYRWASETSAVSVAYGPHAFTAPMGYNLCVRGAGVNTQLIGGYGSSSSPQNYALLFTTANGSTFSFTALGTIANGNSDLYGGIGFGTNNTFYAQPFPSTALEYVSFNTSTHVYTNVARYPLSAPSGSLGPLAVDLVNSRIIALATATTSGTTHTVNLFDMTTLTSGANTPVGTINLSAGNPNPTGSGSICLTTNGGYAFVLDSQNGITAYELTPKPSATVPVTAARCGITNGPGSNYTINYSGGEAVNYILWKSLNANAAMSTWTVVATNSGSLSSSNFVVTPSGTRTFYRISSRSY
jgi:hypothetical protein